MKLQKKSALLPTHDKHQGHSPEMFRRKFWVALFLTVPILAYSETIQKIVSIPAPAFPGSDWLPTALGVVVFFYGGLVFLRGARAELADRLPGMMTLISLAITVAFGYSLGVSVGLVDGMDFWWELATLITIMLLGHWLEMASVMSAQGALKELAKLLPDEAEVVSRGGTHKVVLSQVKADDLVLVRPGAQVPVDGQVVDGDSDVNESMLTGESKPVKKTVGAAVIGGTINGNGALTVKVSKTGGDTALAGIMRLVAEAQQSKSKTQILADRAAFYLTILALGAATITGFAWTLWSQERLAFILERIVTVLVIACPHALGLAIPLVTAISTTLAARSGLLVRQRKALEAARNIDIVLFDKTGTLTKGQQGVTDVWPVAGYTDREVLALAASVEHSSEHIIGKGIVHKAQEYGLRLETVQNFGALPGMGVKGTVKNATYMVVSRSYLREQSIGLPQELSGQIDQALQDGKTDVYVLKDVTVIGGLALADEIRDESRQTIQALKAVGIKSAMITGDSKEVAAYVARELGLDQFFAEVRPEDKASKVRQLQEKGQKVAMVGDGVNDAPALTQADIGIAIGAGTDVAIESAGIILASNDPRGVAKVIHLSKATYRKMQQNLAWAVGYNLVAIPLAAGATAVMGFVLSPAVGAVLMSLSTIVVAINAQFLRRVKL